MLTGHTMFSAGMAEPGKVTNVFDECNILCGAESSARRYIVI